MRARVVIGANYGDEGKGLITDYLCAVQGAEFVVRFNGGAQAAHTVVTPDGYRHVFSHFGSGTFCRVPTYLSKFFVCNPIMFSRELKELLALNSDMSFVYASPDCLVSTFADMWINQQREYKRGAKRHGSTGMGVNETIRRSTVPELKITMADLWNGVRLEPKLREICGKYAEYRTGEKLADPDAMITAYLNHVESFANLVHPLGIAYIKDPVFEGAQGLCLDQDLKEAYPHVTCSNTGMKNVRELCNQMGISECNIYYISRTYLTRHGAGPLPGEDTTLSYRDDTNGENKWQGKLRFAPLDFDDLLTRCFKDSNGEAFKLVLTHCDQHPPPTKLVSGLYSDGPTRAHVREKL